MGAMASLITSLTSVYPTVHPGADQRMHQSSASLAFVRGIHRRPVNSTHKWPVTRKIFPFDDVVMYTSWLLRQHMDDRTLWGNRGRYKASVQNHQAFYTVRIIYMYNHWVVLRIPFSPQSVHIVMIKQSTSNFCAFVTYSGRDQIITTFQTIFSNAFP